MRSEGTPAARKGRTRAYSALPPVCRVRLSLRCARLSAADRSPAEAVAARPFACPREDEGTSCGRSFVRRTCLCAERARRSNAAMAHARCMRARSARLGSESIYVGNDRSAAALTSGIRTAATLSTHRGYSGYSHGVVWVLTGGTPSAHRGVLRVLTGGPLDTHRGYSGFSQGYSEYSQV
jgi:hypothetical protein